ncbi:hypothetical protein [Actinoplanes aureus]|uniref:Uncharacterized protein n=1 Tax=Actinoplanes aureus TaxID=2792083 RepID=A0A931CDH1_9ACTN|nr:hypothetical protein [Actinoplanes aureus]MBG0562885.1 hypothetical protein [Actinoplanes aureus]
MIASSPYGLSRPTMDDARAAVLRVHAGDGRRIWDQLLHAAGLTGRETDDSALDRLLTQMSTSDATTRLCALALRIRVTSHTHLAAAAQSITRS